MINTRDPQLYEHLSLICSSYEEQAIRSGKRAAFLAVAKGPLTGFEQILSGADTVLAESERRGQQRSTGRIQGSVSGSLTDPDQDLSVSLQTDGADQEFDADLLDLLSQEGPVGDFAARYLSECLGCEGRIQFGWQLKPINLLANLDKLLDQIEGSLDRFTARLDPLQQLSGLCNLLNAFKVFCLQDILMVLMSIKMLIRRYMQNTLKVRLDWTAILGPLLKVVLDGIANLIGDAGAILEAPLDCAAASLKTSDQIYRQARELLQDLTGIATGLNTSVDGQLGIGMRNIKWEDGRLQSKDSVIPFPGTEQDRNQGAAERFGNQNRTPNQRSADLFGGDDPGLNLPTGFDVDARMTVADALRHSQFAKATPIQKILVPLQEARDWIHAEIEKINRAVKSLSALTGDGLVVNLDNLGVLLFLTDVVGLIGLIVRMLRQGNRQTDWCRVLADNPQQLEQQLARTADGVAVERDGDSLRLRRGRDIVGEIPLCSNRRTEADTDLVAQWIAELS